MADNGSNSSFRKIEQKNEQLFNNNNQNKRIKAKRANRVIQVT